MRGCYTEIGKRSESVYNMGPLKQSWYLEDPGANLKVITSCNIQAKTLPHAEILTEVNGCKESPGNSIFDFGETVDTVPFGLKRKRILVVIPFSSHKKTTSLMSKGVSGSMTCAICTLVTAPMMPKGAFRFWNNSCCNLALQRERGSSNQLPFDSTPVWKWASL